MKYLPENTLAHYNAAPQTHLHNWSDLPTQVFSASTTAYKLTCGMESPMKHAVEFYTLNHAASIVRSTFTVNEPLPEWAVAIMDAYTTTCIKQGERMLHYLLLVTVREMRHLKSQPSAALWTQIKNQFGEKTVEFLKVVSSHGGEDEAMGRYLNQAPADMTVGAMTKAMSYAYHHGAWSSSYGGPAWGGIADALASVIAGETSMEMMVDTGYTLAHNTAPVFNKGLMYTGPNATMLATILDVQRAGEMLNLMVATEALGVDKPQVATMAVELLQKFFPVNDKGEPTIRGYVDWKAVDAQRPAKEKSSSPNKYAKVIAAQKQPKKKVDVKPTLATFLGKQAKEVGTFQVFPNQSVTVFERVS